MSSTQKMFDDMLNDTESFFIPTNDGSKEKKKSDFVPNVDGEFLGHLQESECKEVSWERDGKKFKAIVYNYQFVVDNSNSINVYKLNNGDTVKGEEYSGRSYRSNGIFRFLEPKEGDDFVSNAEGNKQYLWFCQTLNVEIPRKVVQIKGQDVEVQVLPQLQAKDINGKPAIAVIGKGKSYKNKEGQDRTPFIVKFVKTWKDGVIKDADIPF
jgi:hypothetical protein